MDILEAVADARMGSKRATLMLQELGIAPERAQEFVSSVQEEIDSQPIKTMTTHDVPADMLKSGLRFYGMRDVPAETTEQWLRSGQITFSRALGTTEERPNAGFNDRAAVFEVEGTDETGAIPAGASFKVSSWEYVTPSGPLDFKQYFEGTDYDRQDWPEAWSPELASPGHYVLRLQRV